MDLLGFFRSLPPETLIHYRNIHLERGGQENAPALERRAAAGLHEAELNQLAERLHDKLSNRRWVRDQLKKMPRSHHVALVALLQCQGIAGGTWLLQELTQAHGMSEDMWAEVLHALGGDLWVFGNSHQSPPLFYILPEPIAAVLMPQFRKRLGLLSAQPEGAVRRSKDTNYRYPVGYSVTAFLTFIRQNRIRVTRQQQVFKKQMEEMWTFFQSFWGGDPEEVCQWHLDLVRELGLVRQRGGYMAVDDLAMSEFVSMGPEKRRQLYLSSFFRREPLTEWLLDALRAMKTDDWVPLKRLRTVYRRRYMGGVFHRRYVRKSYYLPPSGFYDPTPPLQVLQVAGLLESGLGEDGSYLRLSEAGRAFASGKGFAALEANKDVRFLLQPTFEVLAPVGLDVQRLWQLGALAALQQADRASTYLITRESLRSALDEGWRADDLLTFLRKSSAVALPQNVESTIRDWVGDHGEVELHDALVMSVKLQRVSAVKDVLKKRKIPYETLAETVFAIPRETKDELLASLARKGLEPANHVRTHDLADDPATRRGHLHTLIDDEGEEALDSDAEAIFFPTKSLVMLGAPSAEGGREAMAQRGFRSGRSGANRVGADLSLKPAAAGAGDLLKLSPAKTISVVKAAIRRELDLDVLYPSTADDDPGGLSRVTPTDLKEAGGASYFAAHCHRLDREVKYQIKRIQGIRLAN